MAENKPAPLRAVPLRERGIRDRNDFDIQHDGVSVGRIYESIVANGQKSWFWSVAIICPGPPLSASGHLNTREEAMAAARAAFDRFAATPSYDFDTHRRIMDAAMVSNRR